MATKGADGAFCSLSDDTLVSIAHEPESITAVEVGDYVLADDKASGAVGFYPLTAVWVHDDPVILLLTIDGEVVETTPEHPFYTEDGVWVAAGVLEAGDRIYEADGDFGTVESVAVVYRLQPMYNLTVARAHTYFVGDEQWLVHNDCDIFFRNFQEGSGFSGVFDPETGHFVIKPSGDTLLKDGTVPSGRVDRFGGHGTINRQLAEQGIDPSRTVGFTVFYDGPEQLSVAWNSGVNTTNFGSRAAPAGVRQTIMDVLQRSTGFTVVSR